MESGRMDSPMKHCPYCSIDYEPRRLRDPETCPECGGELKAGVVNCHHRDCTGRLAVIRDINGIERCAICGEEGPQ